MMASATWASFWAEQDKLTMRQLETAGWRFEQQVGGPIHASDNEGHHLTGLTLPELVAKIRKSGEQHTEKHEESRCVVCTGSTCDSCITFGPERAIHARCAGLTG